MNSARMTVNVINSGAGSQRSIMKTTATQQDRVSTPFPMVGPCNNSPMSATPLFSTGGRTPHVATVHRLAQ